MPYDPKKLQPQRSGPVLFMLSSHVRSLRDPLLHDSTARVILLGPEDHSTGKPELLQLKLHPAWIIHDLLSSDASSLRRVWKLFRSYLLWSSRSRISSREQLFFLAAAGVLRIHFSFLCFRISWRGRLDSLSAVQHFPYEFIASGCRSHPRGFTCGWSFFFLVLS